MVEPSAFSVVDVLLSFASVLLLELLDDVAAPEAVPREVEESVVCPDCALVEDAVAEYALLAFVAFTVVMMPP